MGLSPIGPTRLRVTSGEVPRLDPDAYDFEATVLGVRGRQGSAGVGGRALEVSTAHMTLPFSRGTKRATFVGVIWTIALFEGSGRIKTRAGEG